MSHEHEHDQPQAAPKRTSRRSPARGWTGTGQPAEDQGLTPAQEQQWRAARLHQGRQVLQGYAARAAARAGAPTDAAHAAHDGHTALGVASGTPTHQARQTPTAHLVNQDLARHDYVGAIQAMDKDPDAHESQRLAATITSHLDAYLGGLSMDDLLCTLHNLDTHGCLGQIQAALINGATGLTQERLAFAGAVLAFGIDALEGPRPRYLSDHAADYEGAVTYLQLSTHPTPSRSSQRVAQDLAQGNVVGAFQVLDKDADRTERLYLLEMILRRLEDWLGGQRGMYELLRALGPLKAQGYLDRRTERGDTFQALLLNTAHGLGKDRLAFALSILTDGPEALTPSDHRGYLPQYLVGPPAATKGGVITDVTHFDDIDGAIRYLEGAHRGWHGHAVGRIFSPLPVDSPEVYESYISDQVAHYQFGAEAGTWDAIKAIAGDGFDYSAFWLSVAGAVLVGQPTNKAGILCRPNRCDRGAGKAASNAT